MEFEFIDRYLLDGGRPKAEVVKTLLADPSDAPGAAPFYEGIRLLGERTPDLTLIALRLVLAGKKADDDQVVRLRGLIERAKRGGQDGEAARSEYATALRS
jgi:hypothetical protein